MREIVLGVRFLWRDKAFTVTAGLTLAVCIGAYSALFTVVDHVLLRPLQIPESDRVLLVYNGYPKAGIDHAGATAPDYFDRQELTVFEEQALFNTRDPSFDLNGSPERIHVMQVTPSFFRLVRVPPQRGRAFTEAEGELGQNRVVVLSAGLSQRLWAGSSEPIGQTVRIDGESFTVVGVMPPDFVFIDSRVQAWLPVAFTAQQKTLRFSNNWAYLGRLTPGATLAQAQARIDALNAANVERFPETKAIVDSTGFHTVATRLQDDLVRDVRSILYLLWGGALCVLLIGGVNVASLVLVRSRFRLKEIATRMALGATRTQISRPLVVEHLLLTLGATACGLLLGYAVLQMFGSVTLANLPGAAEIALDGRVVATMLLTAGVMGIVLGTIPVLGSLPVRLATVLRDEGRSGTSGRGVRTMRRALVIVQVAAAFVLLISAGLLLASFRSVQAVDPGFHPEGVLTASVALPEARYADNDAIRGFTDAALQRLRSLPGVTAVGVTTSIPLGTEFSQDVMLPEGYNLGPDASLVGAYRSIVTPGYFEAMGVRLVRGRFFEARDTVQAPRAVIVDEQLARRYWPGLDPTGRRMFEPSDAKNILAVTDKTQWFTVIGVVGEIKLRGLVEGVGETGAYYTVQAQTPRRGLTFAVRTAADATTLAASVRRTIAALDRQLPVSDLQTMEERTERSLVTRRSSMLLSLAFGGIALFLAAVGIYGVLAYLVTQRRKEIGIRLALGSSTAAVLRLVLRESVALIMGGFALGAIGALAVGRSLENQLFGVRSGDPVVVVLAVLILTVVAMVACVLPARQATRIDPVIALAE